MRQPPLVQLSLLAAGLLLPACTSEPVADAANANGAAPAAATTPAQDSAAATAVVAAMHRMYDGFVNRDSAAVSAAVSKRGMLYSSDDGVMLVTSPEGTTAMVKACITRSFTIDSIHASVPAPDIVVLASRLTIDETCQGKQAPRSNNVLSVWQRQGTQWRAVAFSAAPLAEAK